MNQERQRMIKESKLFQQKKERENHYIYYNLFFGMIVKKHYNLLVELS